MSNVYFVPVAHNAAAETLSKIGRQLLETIVQKENITLEKEIPLKLHFGEKGNHTYLKPEIFDPIIDFLEEQKRKEIHDRILADWGLRECNIFDWGTIKSNFDTKGNVSSVNIVYKNN